MDFSRSPQLYIISFYTLFASIMSTTLIPFLGDACKRAYGTKCDSAESVLQNYMSMWLLWIAVLIFTLTVVTKDNASKLKRLSVIVIYILMTQIACIILAGSQAVGGIYPRGVHVVSMIIYLILILILGTSIMNDSPIAGPDGANFYSGIGLNCKGYVALLFLLLLVWIFYSSDFQVIDENLADVTELSKLGVYLWNGWSLSAFEVLLLNHYILAYANEKEAEGTTIAIACLFAFHILVVYAIGTAQAAGIITLTVIQSGVFIVLAVAAVARSRMMGRSDYQPVSESTNV